MPKRPRRSQSISAATTPDVTVTSTGEPRPAKRTRLDSPAATTTTTETVQVDPKQPLPPPAKRLQILEPKKRKAIAGRLNRLAVPKPISLAAKRTGSGSTKPDINRRGNKINKGWGTGGFDAGVPLRGDEDLGEAVINDTAQADPKGKGKGKEVEVTQLAKQSSSTKNMAELWVTRKTSYPSYLRAGLAAFVDKGHHTLILRALGAAIPVCLSLTMAIRDALPCGEEGCDMQVRTSSIDVNDEIVPDDDSDGDDQDIQYQVRTKSSVECLLILKKHVRNRLLVRSSGVNISKTLGAREMGVRPGRGGRGKPIRGGGRGRGSNRGRGA